MTGKFVVSLDCEGMWGMADKPLTQRNHVTNEGLVKAYSDILELFRTYEIPATFAFVGMFSLTEKERNHFEPKLGTLIYNGEDWLKYFKIERENDQLDGWFCPEAIEMVRNEGVHEIGSHGFTHMPFDGADTPLETLLQELELTEELGEMRKTKFQTLVYPRNRIGFLDRLNSSGIKGYRELLQQKGGPAARLIRELNIFEKSQRMAPAKASLVPIPPGYFVNWKKGARKHIPRTVSKIRWKSILKHAAENGGVAHAWLHPHNIISAPETMAGLGDIIRQVAKLRDEGKLVVQTQERYTNHLLSGERPQ